MARKALIQKYQDMMYKYGEFDVWDDDIEPKLSHMSLAEIRDNYRRDKAYYESREKAGGFW